MRAQSYLFVESESFFINGHSRLCSFQFLLVETSRHVKTIQKYELKTNHNYLETIKYCIPVWNYYADVFYTCGEGCDAFNKYYVWLKEICCLLPSISNKLGMINHFYNIFYLTQNWLSPVSNILSISQLNCGRECVLLKMSSCEP